MTTDKKTAGSVKKKKAKVTVESLTQQHLKSSKSRGKSKTSKSESAQDFSKIKDNVFFKAMTDESTTPSEKVKAIGKLQAFTGDKEEARTNLKQFEEFKAYLQAERKDMAREIIKLTDTNTYAELRAAYDDMHGSFLEFDELMAPFVEIVDAVYSLRMGGVTMDIYDEIRRDKEAEANLVTLQEEQSQKLEKLQGEITTLEKKNATLVNEKSWGGLGGTTKNALNKIAENEVTLRQKEVELEALTDDINSTAENGMPASEFEQYAEEKAKFRELLDISSEDHQAQQDLLVSKAVELVDKSDHRIGQVLQRVEGLGNQMDRLSDSNYRFASAYAVLNEAGEVAVDITEKAREGLKKDIGSDSEIVKIQAEDTLRHLENHVTSLNNTGIDTTMVLAELTQSGSRIQAMKETNGQQIAGTRSLHTSGVAGVADNLSSVLQAISSASLGEARAAAQTLVGGMKDQSSDIAAKEAFRVAMGLQGTNAELTKALEELENLGDLTKATAEIKRGHLTEQTDLLDKMEKISSDVKDSIAESRAVAADVLAAQGIEPANDDKPEAPRPSFFGSRA